MCRKALNRAKSGGSGQMELQSDLHKNRHTVRYQRHIFAFFQLVTPKFGEKTKFYFAKL